MSSRVYELVDGRNALFWAMPEDSTGKTELIHKRVKNISLLHEIYNQYFVFIGLWFPQLLFCNLCAIFFLLKKFIIHGQEQDILLLAMYNLNSTLYQHNTRLYQELWVHTIIALVDLFQHFFFQQTEIALNFH